MPNTGKLQINVTSNVNIPIESATINLTYAGQPDNVIEVLRTNNSGQTDSIDLAAPPVDLSLTKDNIIQPYSEYSIYVTAEGYEPVDISGIEILTDTASVQEVKLTPATATGSGSDIVIPAHTLYGVYPPKIAEDEIKPMDESGEIVLSRVVVPETIIVHDGSPSDNTAKNYYVPFRD